MIKINITETEFNTLFNESDSFRQRVFSSLNSGEISTLSFVNLEIKRQFGNTNNKIGAIKWFRQYCQDTGETFGLKCGDLKYPGLSDSKTFVEKAFVS